MKLNWFSPVPPTPSPAALETAAVLPSLAKHATVTLWVHETTSSPDLDQHARVCRYDPSRMPWAEINAADATLYHLGNDEKIYGPIRQVNRQHPGIVVLHDYPVGDVTLEDATAVVVHTQAAYSLVSSYTTSPVAFVPLLALTGTASPEGEISGDPTASGDRPETVEGYVRGILDLVRITLDAGGREAVRWMAGRTGRAIEPWFT